MPNSTRKVENVWTVGQSIRPFGDGTALAITCAMPVAFTTRWMGWTGHWSSSLVDWYFQTYYFFRSVINTLYMLCIKHPQWRGDAAAILIFAKAGFPSLVNFSSNSFVCVPVAAEPGHGGGVAEYYKNYYSQGYNGAKRAPFQTTEEKSSRRLVGFKKRASLSPSFLK